MRTESITLLPPLAIRNGILVLSGYGLRVSVQRRHLVVSDGICGQRRELRLAKATTSLRRLVILGHTGTVSLEALRWLSDARAGFVHIDVDGRVILASGPVGFNEARLRRAQAMAVATGGGLEIVRNLIREKLEHQAIVVDSVLDGHSAAAYIRQACSTIQEHATVDRLRLVEADAAAAYWRAWETIPIRFARRDEGRVPEHWRVFGTRTSPLTGSPRLAANPANALLNYLYAILEAEGRMAALAVGLDPGLGILHADQGTRDSLICDLMEPVRPQVDAWVLSLLQSRTFSIHDFAETRRGVCRVIPPVTQFLAETAPTWACAVAPIAERMAQFLLNGEVGERRKHPRPLPTPLTQANRSAGREGVRRRPTRVPRDHVPKMPQACRMCGIVLDNSDRFYCDECLPEVRKEKVEAWSTSGRRTLAQLRAENQDPAHGGCAAQVRGEKISRHNYERAKRQGIVPPTTDRIFPRDILPHLRNIALPELAMATGLSVGYCSFIVRGLRVPHPRHWAVLEALAQQRQTCPGEGRDFRNPSRREITPT